MPSGLQPNTYIVTLGTFNAKSVGLGGWILSPHHFYDVVGKRLYMGNGVTREITALTAPGGKLFVSSQDGSEVYFFDSTGKHIETRTGLIGALLYSFSYDAQNNLTAITDSFGNATAIAHLAGNPVSITSPFGQITSLGVDSGGFLKTVSDPSGNTFAMVTSNTGLLLSFQKPQGQSTNLSYDSTGRLINETHSSGNLLNLSRQESSSGYTVSTATALSRNTTYDFSQGPSTVNTLPNVTRNVTDPADLVTKEQNARVLGTNNVIQDTIDTVQYPFGMTVEGNFLPDPRFGSTSEDTIVTTVLFGNSYSLSTVKLFVPDSTLVAPYNIKTLSTSHKINGDPFVDFFDNATKTVTSTTPLNRKVITQLDIQERPVLIQPGDLTPVGINYDTRGRLAQTTQGTRTTTLAYNPQGFLGSVQNSLNQSVTFTYDSVGNVTSQTLADGRIVKFTYDKNSNLTGVVPPGKPVSSFVLNAFELLASFLPPALGITPVNTTYSYNLDRQLTQISRPDGTQVIFNYDPVKGRLLSTVLPSGTFTYTYSATTGLPTQVTSPDGVVSALTFEGPFLDSYRNTGTSLGSSTISINNDFLVSRSFVGSSGFSSASFIYDKDRKLTSMAVGTTTETLTYDATDGILSGTSLTHVSEGFGHDSFGDLSNLSSTFTPPLGGAVGLLSENVTRDAIGRISTKSETLGATTNNFSYVYDLAGRLTSVSQNGASRSQYTYDSNSNRITQNILGTVKVASFDDQDRLLTFGNNSGGTSYFYNNNGELISKVVNPNPSPTPTPTPAPSPSPTPTPTQCKDRDRDDHHDKFHDVLKKLKKWVHRDHDDEDRDRDEKHGHRDHDGEHHDKDDCVAAGPSPSPTPIPTPVPTPAPILPLQTTNYTYDALGNLKTVTLPNGTVVSYLLDWQNRRVAKKINGAVVSTFLYTSQTKIEGQLDSLGNIVSRFVYGARANVPDFMVQGTVIYKIISDHLGSPRLVVNTLTGQIAEQIDYDEFGNVLSDSNPGFIPFGFAGGLYDQDTKLVHFGARDYDPEVGRFITRDPILFDGGDMNLYGYAFNNPINLIDPSGLAACDYNITTGVLTCTNNSGGTFTSPGWISGLGPFANDPGLAGVENVGPIPPGNYYIGDLIPGTQKRRLQPQAGNTMLGRQGGFETHNCPKPDCSTGCVASPQKGSLTDFNNFLNLDTGSSTLNVHY